MSAPPVQLHCSSLTIQHWLRYNQVNHSAPIQAKDLPLGNHTYQTGVSQSKTRPYRTLWSLPDLPIPSFCLRAIFPYLTMQTTTLLHFDTIPPARLRQSPTLPLGSTSCHPNPDSIWTYPTHPPQPPCLWATVLHSLVRPQTSHDGLTCATIVPSKLPVDPAHQSLVGWNEQASSDTYHIK